MSTLPEINILQISRRAEALEGFKSENSKGDDIFQSILNGLNGVNSDGIWVSKLYSDNGTKKSYSSGLRTNPDNLNFRVSSSEKNSSGRRTQQNSHNPEDLIVPSNLQNQLVAFLEKQGFSPRDINQVLSASKNSNGLIQLDNLLAGLAGISSNNTAGKNQGISFVTTFKESFSSFLSEEGINLNNFGTFFSTPKNSYSLLSGNINDLLTGDKKDTCFIESTQIPGVQEMLFKLGLGVGDVKNIIDKSKNGKGEIELGKLSSELNKFLSSPLSESDLAAVFSKNNISVRERLFNTDDSGSDKKNQLTDSFYLHGDKSQTELKQNIEAMLKEKGIQEENIKSLLEKLDTAFTKMDLEKGATLAETAPVNQKILSILQREKQIISGVLGDTLKKDIAALLKKKGSSDKDVKSFLESFGINIKKANTVQGENYLRSSLMNEKTFGILKDDQLLSTADQGNLKLNLTELLNLAEKKATAARLAQSFEGSEQPVKNSFKGKGRSTFILKETQQISGLNISQENGIKNIGKINQTSTAGNLPDPLPRIVDKVMLMIRTGEYKSRLTITPPELGKLDIDLTIKNGHIHANLSTENAVVKEIIEANLNQLKQQLNNHGLTVDRFDIMVGLENGKRDEGNTWTEGRNGKGSGRNTGLKTDEPMEILASQPVSKGLISNSKIDVHV